MGNQQNNNTQAARGSKPEAQNLATKKGSPETRRTIPYVEKSVYRTRMDIRNWNIGQTMWQSAEEPSNYMQQLLYSEMMLDALLTSQVENRKRQPFSVEFALKTASGEVDEEQTAILKKLKCYRQLTNARLDAEDYGYSLGEFNLIKMPNGIIDADFTLLPRTNIVPKKGLFYPDYGDATNKINYRELPEYGTWLLEYNTGELGRLNKAVPHVLFKRFAQSCWSELCEIYGIPPRVLKTDSQDRAGLARAEKMMRDMGSAAWFIIDTTEAFEWAQGVNTNGDVYKNLIDLCRNEICLLYTGAIIGQDTQNGSRSKDEAGQTLLWELVQNDLALLEQDWNGQNLPALVKLGLIKPGLTFEFLPNEDIGQLWKFTEGILPYKTVDNDWIKNKFGVEVTGDRQTGLVPPDAKQGGKKNLWLGADSFFD